MPERDLFANFERMRREMDELFGDVFGRTIVPPSRGGFCPPVDVVYVGDPPRAVVRAELAGVRPEEIEIDIQGRELVISGERRAPELVDAVYQQLEIEHGPFRRAVQLGADVEADSARAVYEDGVLRVELVLVRPEPRRRSVPIEAPGSEQA